MFLFVYATGAERKDQAPTVPYTPEKYPDQILNVLKLSFHALFCS